MVARKLVLHLMVLSPAMLLSSIAIESRIGYEPLDEAATLPDAQRQITAYLAIVRLTEQTVGPGTSASPDQVRDVADQWIEGTRSGTLQSLPPQHPLDSPREGARGQIFEARAQLIGFLQMLARTEMAKGNYADAARDSMKTVRVAETMKYSELYVVGASSMEQRTALNQVLQALPHLTPEELAGIRAECQDVLSKQEPIDKLIQLNRQQFQSSYLGNGTVRLSAAEGQQMAAIETMVRSDANPNLVINEIRRTVSDSNSGGMPLYLSSVRLGIQAQEQLRVKLQTIALPKKERPTQLGGL